MIKKILIIFIVLIIGILIVIKTYDFSNKTWNLEIEKDSINSIEIIKYGVFGIKEEYISNIEEINEIYNYLINIKIGSETTISCDDNTQKYILHFKNKKDKIIEIECSTITIDNKKYKIKKVI